eukprot:TRINITY_DN5641_c0_g2_i2.p1 TRINITY_DN5641_c0_g2~~TRINITY_DN5641_c0_g2_i2.p1  ORF type:complete len:167 (-),score=13.76 TRINITY_DN5641_c0_g2_i2:43-543(-)
MDLPLPHKPNLSTAKFKGKRSKRVSERVIMFACVSLEARKKLKCHICRDRQEGKKLVICVNYQLCKHAFCHKCIDIHFRLRAKKEYLRAGERGWPCFVCRGLCKCRRCKRALAEELATLSSIRNEDEDSRLGTGGNTCEPRRSQAHPVNCTIRTNVISQLHTPMCY